MGRPAAFVMPGGIAPGPMFLDPITPPGGGVDAFPPLPEPLHRLVQGLFVVDDSTTALGSRAHLSAPGRNPMSGEIPAQQAPSNQAPSTQEKAGATAPGTFTQEQVNALVAETRRKTTEKFADYEDLKAKASEYDVQKDAGRSEAEKAEARAKKAEQELAAAREQSRQLLVEAVAAAKGVPAGHITGTTREELEASADQLIAWRGAAASASSRAPGAPAVPAAGTGSSRQTASGSLESGRERARAKREARKSN